MTASQRARQKCAQMEDTPILPSEDINCCCMIAPWIVTEEGRPYQLKITQKGQRKAFMSEEMVNISVNEPPSNKEKNRYELHIVAPPLDNDGKPTYKKITSNHKFLKKECDLKMLVKSKKQEKSISEGGSFEIDTNGNIKGAMGGGNCEEEKEKPIATATPAAQQPVGRNACIAGPQKETYKSAIPNHLDISNLHNRYLKGSIDTISEKDLREIEEYLAEADYEDVSTKNDLTYIIKGIINPDAIAKRIKLVPTGSTKCKMNPKVFIFVHDKTVYKGEVSVSYGFMHTTALDRVTSVGKYRNERIDVTRSAFKAEGKLEYIQGDTHYIVEPFYALGIDADGNRQVTSTKRKYQHTKRIGAENIFKGFQEKVNTFHRFFEKVQKAQSSPISIDTGLTKFTFKADGSTDENPTNYDLSRCVKNLEFEIALFDGSAITLDIFELGCSLSSGIGMVLSKARKYAQEHGQEIKLEFSMGGSINGNLKFEKPQISTPWKAQGSLSGAVNVELLGKVHMEGSVLWVSVAAGAYFKTASTADIDNKTEIKASLYAATKKDKISIDGDLTFNGMTMYYAAYVEVNKKREQSDEDVGGGIGHKTNAQVVTKREFKSSDRWDMIPAWESGKHHFGEIENILS